MIQLRPAGERGVTRTSWLDSRHSFSFGHYRDPRHMGFGNLRVINDDTVAAGGGFGPHGHRDMEIVSYILDGELAHKDSLGTGSVIRPGEAQRMSAGGGIEHSEFNPSPEKPVHFLQIWLLPDETGIAAGYEQKALDLAPGRLAPVATRDGRDGSVTIHADAAIYAARLQAGQSVSHDLAPGRRAWVQVARGRVRVNNAALGAGDGAALSDEGRVTVAAAEDAEILVFDLA